LRLFPEHHFQEFAMATKFEKYGVATLVVLFLGGAVGATLSEDYPQPPTAVAEKQPEQTAIKMEDDAGERKQIEDKLARSREKTFAVSIVLSGYGCSKVLDINPRSVKGKTIVSCVERKGRPNISKYQIDEDRLFSGRDDAVRPL
jgi:hypothetical protein